MQCKFRMRRGVMQCYSFVCGVMSRSVCDASIYLLGPSIYLGVLGPR